MCSNDSLMYYIIIKICYCTGFPYCVKSIFQFTFFESVIQGKLFYRQMLLLFWGDSRNRMWKIKQASEVKAEVLGVYHINWKTYVEVAAYFPLRFPQ